MFLEERRWLFQKQNPDWYVPDLKPKTNWSLEVTLHPVCYAPLKPATNEKHEPHIVHQAANKCQCGVDAPGFGTECAKETRVKLPDSSERCVYLRSVRDEIRIHENKSSLSTGLDIISWLQDVYVSGKYAGLRLADRTEGQKKGRGLQGPREWHFNVTDSSKRLGCTNFDALTARRINMNHHPCNFRSPFSLSKAGISAKGISKCPTEAISMTVHRGVDQCQSKQCRIHDEATRNHLQSSAIHPVNRYVKRVIPTVRNHKP